jgi:glutamyl-Q tRNA(Asp) synthetase
VKSAGGEWLIRIEDLDSSRVLSGCAGDHLALLEKAGLKPDGEVVHQSRRIPAYDRLFKRLHESALVYPCRCSRKEIASAASAPILGTETRYPGTCRDLEIPASEIRAWRFRVPEETVEFRDEVFGDLSEDVLAQVGDFVIRRETPERTYAYQFAVVADDTAQGITQVVRGADLLDSTARQILLARTLGFPIPRHAHIPVLVSQSGEKLSKRAGGRELPKLASSGRLPSIVAALLTTLGQKPTLEEALRTFDPSRIPKQREIRLAPPP